jgi:hypothetical protein
LTLLTGLQAGAARVQVTACGRTNTLVVYNGGYPPIPGIPDWFPRRLRGGQYVITASGMVTNAYYDSQTGWHTSPAQEIPGRVCGTIAFRNLRDFATQTMGVFQDAIASILNELAVSGCTQKLSVTGFNGSSFTVTYAFSCSSATSTIAVTLNFTVQQQ